MRPSAELSPNGSSELGGLSSSFCWVSSSISSSSSSSTNPREERCLRGFRGLESFSRVLFRFVSSLLAEVLRFGSAFFRLDFRSLLRSISLGLDASWRGASFETQLSLSLLLLRASAEQIGVSVVVEVALLTFFSLSSLFNLCSFTTMAG